MLGTTRVPRENTAWRSSTMKTAPAVPQEKNPAENPAESCILALGWRSIACFILISWSFQGWPGRGHMWQATMGDAREVAHRAFWWGGRKGLLLLDVYVSSVGWLAGQKRAVKLMVTCHLGNFKGFCVPEIPLCLRRAKPLLLTTFSSVRKPNIIESGLWFLRSLSQPNYLQDLIPSVLEICPGMPKFDDGKVTNRHREGVILQPHFPGEAVQQQLLEEVRS